MVDRINPYEFKNGIEYEAKQKGYSCFSRMEDEDKKASLKVVETVVKNLTEKYSAYYSVLAEYEGKKTGGQFNEKPPTFNKYLKDVIDQPNDQMEKVKLKESALKKSSKLLKEEESKSERWNNAGEEEKEEFLLTAVKDPDDVDKYLKLSWEDLPSEISSNIKMDESAGKLNERKFYSANFVRSPEGKIIGKILTDGNKEYEVFDYVNSELMGTPEVAFHFLKTNKGEIALSSEGILDVLAGKTAAVDGYEMLRLASSQMNENINIIRTLVKEVISEAKNDKKKKEAKDIKGIESSIGSTKQALSSAQQEIKTLGRYFKELKKDFDSQLNKLSSKLDKGDITKEEFDAQKEGINKKLTADSKVKRYVKIRKMLKDAGFLN